MSSFLGVPVDAAYHLVSGLTGILTPVLGGLAAVAAIVVFTMAVRLLLMPLSLRALRGQAAQARLAPQLVALRQRHGKQPERLQREMAALYKREGTSMFAGFGPLLLQWPFLSVMYLLFRSPTVGGTANTLLTHDLFGVPLGAHWLSGAGPWLWPARRAWSSSACSRCWRACAGSRPARQADDGPGDRDRLAGAAGAGGSPGLLVRALPYLTVVIAAFAPLAAGIYLLTTLAWSLAERMLYSRPKGWTALSTDRGSRSRRFPPERPSWTQSGPRRRRTAFGGMTHIRT